MTTVTNDFSKPNNTVSLAPLQPPVPGNVQSRNCGGTADILPAERKKATFKVKELIDLIDGGKKQTRRRRFILSPTVGLDVSDKYYWDRPEQLRQHLKHFFTTHDEFRGKLVPNREEVAWMQEYSMLSGTMMNHYGLFLPTIASQAGGVQASKWLPRTIMMKILGAYAQTELGHGSNVRGLQTIAVYDKETQEFILNTPTLQSMKWWPGTLGKVANHAVVYAQLIIDGKEEGLHPFMVQIRDENHRPLPGIELGDLGPKLGDGANDTGFMRLENIRIQRKHMFSRYTRVTKDGKLVKSKKKGADKIHYMTMLSARGAMTRAASGRLAIAVTIAIRYSCIRRQGFKDPSSGASYKSEETPIIDWQVQRYRLLKQLAMAYTLKFTGKWMIDTFKQLEGEQTGVASDLTALPVIASTAAGLKALSTFLCLQGIEECRKCCGGNGYLLNSGVAALAADYAWQTTAEGDYVVLLLQTARFLMKSLASVRNGVTPAGPVDYLASIQDPNFDLSTAAPTPVLSSSSLTLDYLMSLFRYRALSSVVSVSEVMDMKAEKLGDRQAAWNHCALQLVDAVKAHTAYFMLSKFAIAIDDANEKYPAVGVVLLRLCRLFALSDVLDSQWIGISSIGPIQVAIVREAVADLLDELRPDAVALVDSFDIPDRVLCSTLGRYDGNVYEALYNAALKSDLNQTDPFKGYEKMVKPRMDTKFLKQGNSKL